MSLLAFANLFYMYFHKSHLWLWIYIDHMVCNKNIQRKLFWWIPLVLSGSIIDLLCVYNSYMTINVCEHIYIYSISINVFSIHYSNVSDYSLHHYANNVRGLLAFFTNISALEVHFSSDKQISKGIHFHVIQDLHFSLWQL